MGHPRSCTAVVYDGRGRRACTAVVYDGRARGRSRDRVVNGNAASLDMTWRSALLLVTAAPAVAAAIALVVRDVERRAGAWLALFIVGAVLSAMPQIIGFAGFYGRWPGLTFAPFDTELYLPALLYLHLCALVSDRPLGRGWLLLLPGFAQTIYYTTAFLTLGDYRSKWAYNDAIHEPWVVPVETVVIVGLTALVLYAMRRALRRYRAYLEATQSAEDLFDPVWIPRFITWFGLAFVVWGTLRVVTVFVTPISYAGGYPFVVAQLVIISGLGIGALSRIREPFPKLEQSPSSSPAGPDPAAPRADDPDGEPNAGDPDEDQGPADAGGTGPQRAGEPEASAKSAAAPPSSRDWSQAGERLREAMIDGQWYTEPRLSIRDVARRMTTNETYLSRALNEGLGVTFKAFVNGLRVEYAKRVLAATDDPVLAVGLGAGFNSKSTFNRVFREQTGTTPSAYRASQSAQFASQDPN